MTSNIIGGVPIYKKKVIIHEMRNGKWVAVYNCYKKQDDDELVKKQKKEISNIIKYIQQKYPKDKIEKEVFKEQIHLLCYLEKKLL